MPKNKIQVNNLKFVLISIYVTSKMLWDTVPYIFELLFWMVVLCNVFEFIYSSITEKKNTRLILSLLVIYGYIFCNALVKDTLQQFSRSVYEYIIYMFIMLFFIKTRAKIQLITCLKGITFWGTIIAVLTWVEFIKKQYILNDLSAYGQILNVGENGFRAAVFTRSFLSHGVVLGIFTLMFLYLWYELRKTKYLFGGFFCYLSILATGSRGPLVSFFCAIIFLYYADVFLINKKVSKKRKFVLAGLLGVLALYVLLMIDVDPTSNSVSYFVYRVQNIFNWTGDAGNSGRILLWNNAFNNWFLKAPLFGIGPSKTGSWGNGSLGVTESGLLKRLCELGIIGFLFFYAFIFNNIKKCIICCDNSSKKEVIFWMSIIVAIFINDITVQSTEEIMVAFWWWCALGAIYYLKRINKKRKLKYEKNCICNEC